MDDNVKGGTSMSKQPIVFLKSLDAGWLEMELAPPSNDKLTIKLPSTHCEPLSDLLNCLLEIHHCYSETENFGGEEDSFYTFWEGDPWQYTWKITPQQDRVLEIELSFCEDTFAGIHVKDEIQLSTKVSFDALLENLYYEMERTLTRFGFCNYQTRWQSRDFPIANFLKLRKIIFPDMKEPESLAEELELLQNILEAAGE